MKQQKRLFWLICMIFASSLGLKGLLAQSIPLDAEWGAVTWGRAGAAAASARGIDAFSTNPAGLAANYGFGVFGGNYFDLTEGRSSWGIGIIDGRKAVIGGFHFQWYEQDQLERQAYDIAAVYRTTYGAAGVSLNIYRFQDLPENKKNGWKVSQTAGILVPVFYGLTLGAYGQSFLDNIESELQPPFLAMGAAYEKPQLVRVSFQADRRFDLAGEKWNYSIGGDLIAKEFFIARGGYRFDRTNKRSFWSVGGGLEAPKLHAQGFFMKTTQGSAETGWGIEVSFIF